jgi:hypothetical protein
MINSKSRAHRLTGHLICWSKFHIMMLSSTKMVASRLPQVFAARSISSSAVVQLEKSMAELLQEVPPELRIPLIKVDNANIKTGKHLY